jgi:hypothetical protein
MEGWSCDTDCETSKIEHNSIIFIIRKSIREKQKIYDRSDMKYESDSIGGFRKIQRGYYQSKMTLSVFFSWVFFYEILFN